MDYNYGGGPQNGIFLSFAGECKNALMFYQSVFGGELYIQEFAQEVPGYKEIPVISGSLISDRINIIASDFTADEGRKVGNHMAVYLRCHAVSERQQFADALANPKSNMAANNKNSLLEIVDRYGVRWLFGLNT